MFDFDLIPVLTEQIVNITPLIYCLILCVLVSVFSWEIWNSECYYYSNNALENSGAQNSCNKLYSHLVEIETLEEYTELTKYMTNGLQYWTGARIDASNSEYCFHAMFKRWIF